MKGKNPQRGGGVIQPVNDLTELSFNWLPPKLPSKPNNQTESVLLKVRFLPGWDENGNENPQLDPEALEHIDEIRNNDELLGDWVYKAPAFSVRHYNPSTKQESFSWFPGWSVKPSASEEEDGEEIQSPVAEAAWKWFHKLKAFRKRASELYQNPHKGDILKREYDLTSVNAVQNVSAPFDTYFIQVIPLVLGEELDYGNVWGRTILPIEKQSFTESFVNQICTKAEDKPNSKMSVESSRIGCDVVSLEGGWTVCMQRKKTIGEVYPREQLSLDPADGWMNPDTGAWVPWEQVMCDHEPGDMIEDLISVTSKAAVDWALRDTTHYHLVPEEIKGAGAEFNLDPIANTSEVVNESDNGDDEESDEPQQNQENEEQPESSGPAPTPAPASVTPAVSEEVQDAVEEQKKKLQQAHNQ